jgi:hypothetical protein
MSYLSNRSFGEKINLTSSAISKIVAGFQKKIQMPKIAKKDENS